MNEDDIDRLLFPKKLPEGESDEKLVDRYLEQYRIYLHVFNSTNDRQHKSNEFFLGLNAAIMGVLGYVEAKNLPHANTIFMLIPLMGITIGYCWYQIIKSYKSLNKAKFKVLRRLEAKLPVALSATEREILKSGTRKERYKPFSEIESMIPITFIILYTAILIASTLWDVVF